MLEKGFCMNKHLKKSARKYAKTINPNVHKNGLKLAGLVLVSVFVSECILNSLLVHKYVKDYGGTFKKEWMRYNRGQMAAYLCGPLAFALFFLILAELEYVGATEEFKCYSAKAVKRYLHDAHIDVSNIDEETLQDIADLIIANMSEAERDAAIEIGAELEDQLYKIDLQNDIERNKVLASAKTAATKVIDCVLARNPDLEKLLLNILNGEVKYSSKLFAANQKQK